MKSNSWPKRPWIWLDALTSKLLSRKLHHMLLCGSRVRTTSTACKDTSPLRVGGDSSFVLCPICLAIKKKKVQAYPGVQERYRKPSSELLNQQSHPPAHDLVILYFHAPLSQTVVLGFPPGVGLATAYPIRDGNLFSSHSLCADKELSTCCSTNINLLECRWCWADKCGFLDAKGCAVLQMHHQNHRLEMSF